jgi:hypothetical protein
MFMKGMSIIGKAVLCVRSFLLGAAAVMVLTSCLSTAPAASSGGAAGGDVAATAEKAATSKAPSTPAPEWMETYPASDAWYVGIAGVSWTGNESDDRAAAIAAARAELAAAISVTVEREIEIVEEERQSGSRSYLNKEVRQQLRESVKAGLKGVEIVDTWYNQERGYWVYARLSKERWEEQQKEEMINLRRRVEQMLSPMIASGDVPPFSELRQMAKARKLLSDSVWGLLVSGEIDGRSGLLIDLIDQLVTERLDTLMISSEPGSVEAFYGDRAELTLEVRSFLADSPGSVPFLVMLPGGGERREMTDQAGKVSFALDTRELSPGEGQLSVSIDLEKLGFSPDSTTLYPEISMPVSLLIKAPELAFLVDYPGELAGMGLESALRSLFTEKNLPMTFIDPIRGGENPLAIQVEVRVRDFPKYIEDAPEMASAYMQFSLLREGKRLFSYESNSEKEGGLTKTQAHERAIRSLLGALKGEETLFQGIESALFAR